MKRLSTFVTASTAAIVLCLGGAAVALASIPDSAGVIHGCRDAKTGVLRVIDPATSTCTTKKPHSTGISKVLPAPQGRREPQVPRALLVRPVL
jgi:hypothetical protein